MRNSLLSIIGASALLATAASAQTSTTTTTTWTTDQGPLIQKYSTAQHYNSIDDPSLHVTVGTPLPASVTLYSLPETVVVPDRERYSYTIVNHEPVVVEKTTRKVVHTWGE